MFVGTCTLISTLRERKTEKARMRVEKLEDEADNDVTPKVLQHLVRVRILL